MPRLFGGQISFNIKVFDFASEVDRQATVVKLCNGCDPGPASNQRDQACVMVLPTGEIHPRPVTTTRRRPAAPKDEGPLIGKRLAYFFRWVAT